MTRRRTDLRRQTRSALPLANADDPGCCNIIFRISTERLKANFQQSQDTRKVRHYSDSTNEDRMSSTPTFHRSGFFHRLYTHNIPPLDFQRVRADVRNLATLCSGLAFGGRDLVPVLHFTHYMTQPRPYTLELSNNCIPRFCPSLDDHVPLNLYPLLINANMKTCVQITILSLRERNQCSQGRSSGEDIANPSPGCDWE